jgi:hypothetical protein
MPASFPSARAVKTFYLNINVTLDEREVRENADSLYSKWTQQHIRGDESLRL